MSLGGAQQSLLQCLDVALQDVYSLPFLQRESGTLPLVEPPTLSEKELDEMETLEMETEMEEEELNNLFSSRQWMDTTRVRDPSSPNSMNLGVFLVLLHPVLLSGLALQGYRKRGEGSFVWPCRMLEGLGEGLFD